VVSVTNPSGRISRFGELIISLSYSDSNRNESKKQKNNVSGD
jgi:hypothetical protein